MTAEVIQSNPISVLGEQSPSLFLPDQKASERFFSFFTANIRNPNTRRAYYKAACRFSAWCKGCGMEDLHQVKPLHVAAYVEMLGLPEPQGRGLSKPSVKQQLAAPRMLFDWLVVGHTLEGNPAHAVRGPKYSQKKGKTPVLDREEVSDYYSLGRRGWVRQHEKGGKEHEAPCVPKLELFLDEYIAAAGIAAKQDEPLFRTTGRSTGTAYRLTQQDAYRMIQRYAIRAGIKTKIGNHTLRATGVTDYLKSYGSLSEARKMANHADTRTTQLYDRRAVAALDEYGKVGI